MNRVLASGVLAICVVSLAVVAAQQTPVFRGVGDAVRVFVTVLDGDGRLVTKLQRRPSRCATRASLSPSRCSTTRLSRYGSSSCWTFRAAWRATCRCCAPLPTSYSRGCARMTSYGWARLGATSPSVRHSLATSNELRSALPTMIAPDAPTPLWRALEKALEAFDEESVLRPVIIVLSDGKDSGQFDFQPNPDQPGGDYRQGTPRYVMIYAIGMRSQRGAADAPSRRSRRSPGHVLADMPDPGLARVAQETGGGYSGNSRRAGPRRRLRAGRRRIHSQYLLGFAPPRRDGKKHDINVRLTQRGLTAPRAQELRRAKELKRLLQSFENEKDTGGTIPRCAPRERR